MFLLHDIISRNQLILCYISYISYIYHVVFLTVYLYVSYMHTLLHLVHYTLYVTYCAFHIVSYILQIIFKFVRETLMSNFVNILYLSEILALLLSMAANPFEGGKTLEEKVETAKSLTSLESSTSSSTCAF